MTIHSKFISMIASSLLVLSACGGGGGSGDGGDDSGGNNTTESAVRLSGTVGLTTSGRPAERYAARGLANRIGTTPSDEVIIIAVDASGNSYTTMTDRSGEFEFADDEGLVSGTPYALVFIDTSTLQVIGSLVTGTGTAGMLTLAGNTSLEEILINPANGGATIEGTVTVDNQTAEADIADAGSLDADGDGVITQDEITAAQIVAASSGNADDIETVSVVPFFGNVRTWTIQRENADYDYTWTDDACWYLVDPEYTSYGCDVGASLPFDITDTSGEISLIKAAQVQGPNGDLVNASKQMDLTYFSSEIPVDDQDANYLLAVASGNYTPWNNGYASGAQAVINDEATTWGSDAGLTGEYWSPYLDADLGAVPASDYTQKMGLWAWSEFRYIDVENKKLVTGEKFKDTDTGQIKIEWGGFALPLNLPLNTDVPFSEAFTEDYGYGPVTINLTQTLRVRLARNADTTPVLMLESGSDGKNLPVIQVNLARSAWSVSDETGVLFDNTTNIALVPVEYQPIATALAQEFTGTDCFFILAKYGVEVEDFDGDCATTSDAQSAFTDVRFGEVVVDASGAITSVVDRTTSSIADNGADMPESDSSGTTFTTAQSWIGYMFDNSKSIDYVFEPFNFGEFGYGDENWAWVEWPNEGSPLSPQPWATESNPEETILIMGDAVGNVTVNGLHYVATGDGGAQFYLDLRTWDSVNQTENSVLSTGPVTVSSVADSMLGTVVNTGIATTDEAIVDITSQIGNLPNPGAIWTDTWESWEDIDGDSVFEPYESTWVTVWIIMDADTNNDGTIDAGEGRQEFPIDGYRVINPTPLPVQ